MPAAGVFLVAALAITPNAAIRVYGSNIGNEHSNPVRLGGSPPGIIVTVQGRSGQQVTALQGAIVSILSANPSNLTHNATAVNGSGNDIRLFNGTTDSSGVASGSLSATFSAIDSEWVNSLTTTSSTVALELDIVYEFANLTNNSETVYQYYNNIPYNASSPPVTFDAQATIDLSRPMFQLSLALGPSPPPGGTHCGPPPAGFWTILNTTTQNGGLPLALANDSAPGMPKHQLSVADTWYSGVFNVSFNSNEATIGGFVPIEQSSAASYSQNDTTFVKTQASASAEANRTQAVAYVYLGSTTIHVVNDQYTDYYYDNSCVLVTYKWTVTTIDVAKITTSSLTFSARVENKYFGEILQKLMGTAVEIYNQSLGITTPASYWALQNLSTGFSSASNAETQAVSAAGAFVAVLGMGLAVMAAVSTCGPFCTGAEVGISLGLITAALGLATAFALDLSSISFSTTTKLSIQAASFTNAPIGGTSTTPFQLHYYETGKYVELSLNGVTYTPNLPGLIGIGCPPGDSPGFGC